MIKSITAINYLGESLTLELMRPEKSGFIVKKVEGLGPVKADINTTDVCTMDGSMYNSARKTERNVVIYLDFRLFTSIEDARQQTYKYFPVKKDVTLVIETDNRTSMLSGYVESNDPEIFSDQESTQISIICPDPNIYSADGSNVVVFNGIEPVFEFEFENDSLTEPTIEFGTIENKTRQTVPYYGDAEIGVTITIHALGEAKNITIYNVRTREMIHIDTDKLATFTGSGIIAGDEITICTVKGYKGATLLRDGAETNILNCLGKNTSWFQLVKGDNIFAYEAEEGSSMLQFRIESLLVYEGV